MLVVGLAAGLAMLRVLMAEEGPGQPRVSQAPFADVVRP
jgi:hypothetical protein